MLQNLCCWLGNGNCLLPLCPDKPGLHNYGQNYIYNYFVQEHLLEEKKKKTFQNEVRTLLSPLQCIPVDLSK